ncbi:MAG: phosphoribosylanthranilate isomerase [Pseudonocardiaceae bacterium]
MFVKVCGVRTEADVTAVVEAGADAVGLVFGDSVRHVDVDLARRLVEGIPPRVLAVGVFGGVEVRDVVRLAKEAGVSAVQLHGPYPRSAFEQLSGLSVRLLRATTLDADTDFRVGAYGEEMLLLDSAVAGSGHRWELSLLDRARPQGRWLLAGGLSPDNVAEAVAAARPWGVDVSSGVESRRGVKDHGLIRDFVAAARAALADVGV